MSFYGFGEMFDESHYGRTYRKKGDYIFLSVRFGDYGKPDYYRTEADAIEIGDQVVVPVGADGTERIVEVVKKLSIHNGFRYDTLTDKNRARAFALAPFRSASKYQNQLFL